MGKQTCAWLVIILFGILFASCSRSPQLPVNNTSASDIIDISGTIESPNATLPTETTPPAVKPTIPPQENKEDQFKDIVIPKEYAGIAIKKYAIEGDKVQLRPVAVDPDNDKITYTFSKPFDKDGSWQTKVGDAGFYKITVTASDGKDSASEQVLVVIKETNKPPVLDCPAQVLGKEGDLITLDCKASDKEGEDIIIEYAGWMTKKERQTGFDDAGTHWVNVTASDAHGSTIDAVKIIVENTNRPPQLQKLKDITVTEGDLVKVTARASDPDKQETTITYEKPLDSKGEWQTKKGDRGTYNLAVTASDGILSAKETVKIVVNRLNSPPVLKHIDDITVSEGDTITLPIDATDPDDDKVTVTVSGWMSSPTYTTTYNDAGTYSVKVTASDGQADVSQDVNITVKEKNRPPMFKIPA